MEALSHWEKGKPCNMQVENRRQRTTFALHVMLLCQIMGKNANSIQLQLSKGIHE